MTFRAVAFSLALLLGNSINLTFLRVVLPLFVAVTAHAQEPLYPLPIERTGLRDWSELRCAPAKGPTVTGERALKLMGYATVRRWDADAMCWCQIAVDKNYPPAYMAMAHFYDVGQGVQENTKTAFAWKLKGAEAGDKDAMGMVAANYHYGRGVEKNEDEASRWQLKQLGPEGVRKLQQEAAGAKSPGQQMGEAVIGFLFGGGVGDVKGTSGLDPKQPPAGVDPKGWQRVRWGMTRAQIRQAYPDASDYDLVPGTRVFGIEHFQIGDTLFTTVFEFNPQGGLGRVTLRPIDPAFLINPALVGNVERYFKYQLGLQFGESKSVNMRGGLQWEWELGTTRVDLYHQSGAPERIVKHHSLSPSDPRYGTADDYITQERIVAGTDAIAVVYARR